MDNYLDGIPSGSSRSLPGPSAFVLVNSRGPGNAPLGVPAGTGPPSRRTCTVHPQGLCAAAYTHDLARAGVIGACSHASPGSHEVSRTGLPRLDRVAFPGTKPAPLRSRATRQQSPCAPPPTWRPTRACPPAASARSPASHSRSPLPCSSWDFTCRARGPAALEQDPPWPGTR